MFWKWYAPPSAAGDRIWTQSACGKHFAVQEDDKQFVIYFFFWYGNPFAKLEEKLIIITE